MLPVEEVESSVEEDEGDWGSNQRAYYYEEQSSKERQRQMRRKGLAPKGQLENLGVEMMQKGQMRAEEAEAKRLLSHRAEEMDESDFLSAFGNTTTSEPKVYLTFPIILLFVVCVYVHKHLI